MKTYHNTAIVFGNLKDSLLYFEHVIPMNLSGQAMGLRPVSANSAVQIEQFKDPGMDDYRELNEALGDPRILHSLYPPHLSQNPAFKHVINMFDGMLFSYMVKAAHGEETFKSFIGELSRKVGTEKPVDPDRFCPTIEVLQRFLTAIIREYSLQDVPIDCSHMLMNPESDTEYSNVLLAHEIQVIDSQRISLPTIMEFRRDKETMGKMRNFRLFAYEKYSGKGKAYIEDDIQKRLSDYAAAVKACGFDTTVKTLSFLFESKLLLGAFATSAASLLIGNPQLAMCAFGTGAFIEIGKLSLEYAKQKHGLEKMCRENPISYLAGASRLPEKGTGN